MKKLLILLLIGVMASSLLIGCGKKDDAEELDLGEVVEEEVEEEQAKETSKEKEENIPQEIDYLIYLRYADKPFMYDEVFTVNINDEKFKEKTIEEFVLNELFNYQSNGDYTNGIPKGTKILSVERDNTNVIVDLSKEFKGEKMSETEAMLSLGTIVNTLTAIPGNETVQIKVEGELLNEFNGVDTSKPIYFMEGLFPDK